MQPSVMLRRSTGAHSFAEYILKAVRVFLACAQTILSSHVALWASDLHYVLSKVKNEAKGEKKLQRLNFSYFCYLLAVEVIACAFVGCTLGVVLLLCLQRRRLTPAKIEAVRFGLDDCRPDCHPSSLACLSACL